MLRQHATKDKHKSHSIIQCKKICVDDGIWCCYGMCKLHCVVRVKCVFVAQRRQDVCGQTHPHHRVLQRSYKVPMVNTLSRVSVLFGIRNEWTAVVISKLQVSSHPAFLHFSVFLLQLHVSYSSVTSSIFFLFFVCFYQEQNCWNSRQSAVYQIFGNALTR